MVLPPPAMGSLTSKAHKPFPSPPGYCVAPPTPPPAGPSVLLSFHPASVHLFPSGTTSLHLDAGPAHRGASPGAGRLQGRWGGLSPSGPTQPRCSCSPALAVWRSGSYWPTLPCTCTSPGGHLFLAPAPAPLHTREPGQAPRCFRPQCPQLRSGGVIPTSEGCREKTAAPRPWNLLRAGSHLGTELLGGQLEGGRDLLGQHIGLIEAKGVERNLRNHGIIRNHHGHGPEECLGHRVSA